MMLSESMELFGRIVAEIWRLSTDGTGRDFRDPTRPVTSQFDRPVTGRSTGEIYQFLTGRLTG